MIKWFLDLPPVFQAFLATGFTWVVTALGASIVFIFNKINQKTLNAMLGFASGVMIAACYFSLLQPALLIARSNNKTPVWLPIILGFLCGGACLWMVEKILPKLQSRIGTEEVVSESWQRSLLLVVSITLHNLPEGLAIGVAFGAATLGEASLMGALALALGVAIQNLPEGAAVSVPLRKAGMSKRKSFFYGQLSGLIEPLAGIAGAFAAFLIKPLLPFALAFAAGAIIFVVVEELIPESQRNLQGNSATIFALIGFTLMMLLDVAFG